VGGEGLRYETKFVASAGDLARVLAWIELNPAAFRVAHPDRRVNNLYFETLDYGSFAANVSGESDRSKLRYRWYGDSLGPAAGSLELKRRRSGQGWKLRFPIARAPWQPGDDWGRVREALLAELAPAGREWLRAFPMPALLNRYVRRYFLSRDERVRLTLDTQLVVFDQRFQTAPAFARRANLPPMLVVEGKCAPADRARMSRALHGIPMRVSRSSKYVSGLRIASGS
jgi:hypothetical protein